MFGNAIMYMALYIMKYDVWWTIVLLLCITDDNKPDMCITFTTPYPVYINEVAAVFYSIVACQV